MARGRKFATEEERIAAAKASQKRYRSSSKGAAMLAAASEGQLKRRRERYALNINGRRDKVRAWNHAYAAKNKKPRKRKRLTDEERVAAQRVWSKRYKSSPKGKATAAAQRKAYFATAHGKAAAARYAESWLRRTEEQKAARAAWLARWMASPTGKASTTARNHRRRTDGKVNAADMQEVQRTTVCHYCGVGIKTMPEYGSKYHLCRLTVDHRVPIARGGTSERSNLVGACSGCNSMKSAQTEDEFFASGLCNERQT